MVLASASISSHSPNKFLHLWQMLLRLVNETPSHGLGTSHTAAFVLIPGQMSLCMSSLRAESPIPYKPNILIDESPVAFKSQTFWRLVSPEQVPRVGEPDVGHKPLHFSGRSALFMRSPDTCGLLCQGWGLGKDDVPLLLLPISMQPLYSLLWQLFSSFSGPSQRELLHM